MGYNKITMATRKPAVTPNDGTELTTYVPYKNICYHETEHDRIKNRIQRLTTILNEPKPPAWLTDDYRADLQQELQLLNILFTYGGH